MKLRMSPNLSSTFINSSFIPVTLVSQDPANYRDAPTEGIRRILEVVTGTSIPRGQILKTDKIGLLWVHGGRFLSLSLVRFGRLHSPLNHGCYKCVT